MPFHDNPWDPSCANRAGILPDASLRIIAITSAAARRHRSLCRAARRSRREGQVHDLPCAAFAYEIEMVDAAVADLAANADHEGSPDQRNVLIDLDDWSGDALLEGTLRREAFGELRPRLLPEGGCAVRAPAAG